MECQVLGFARCSFLIPTDYVGVYLDLPSVLALDRSYIKGVNSTSTPCNLVPVLVGFVFYTWEVPKKSI